MRIAFVGKGGSGKSTLSSIFSLYCKSLDNRSILLFDADINVHVPELIFGKKITSENFLSKKQNKDEIFAWLLGSNKEVKIDELKKTSTPTRFSNLIKEGKFEKSPIRKFGAKRDNLTVFAVGTYDEGEVGASCYHNNLSVLETILNHTDDKNMFVVADMVAGVDAFAGTMHAQFDMTVLIVEPTKRSIEVFEQYQRLAKESDTYDFLYVVANKIQNSSDIDFVKKHIPEHKILGYFTSDKYLRDLDKTVDPLDIEKISKENKEVIKTIFQKLSSLLDNRNNRLKKIRELHKKYVGQAYVVRAHGDLTNQIDYEFKFK